MQTVWLKNAMVELKLIERAQYIYKIKKVDLNYLKDAIITNPFICYYHTRLTTEKNMRFTLWSLKYIF